MTRSEDLEGGAANLNGDRRRALVSQIRRHKEQIAESVTREFFDRHPDRLERYGDLGWRRGVEDARFHLDFLASAVDLPSTALFDDYARWTARVLAARGIAPHFLIENLRQIENALLDLLGASEERTYLTLLIDSACTAAGDSTSATGGDPNSEFSAERNLFVRTILDGDRRAALTILREALRRSNNVCDVYTGIVVGALHEIGCLWERNQVTVAQEHIATAVVQSVLAQLHADLPQPQDSQGRMLITGVEGEMHQIGALMAADVIESNGWNVRFLGSNLPAASILQTIREFAPTVIGISVTMPFNLPAARDLIARIRAAGNAVAPRIIVGGRAFRSATDARQIGADEFAPDLRSALHMCSPAGDAAP